MACSKRLLRHEGPRCIGSSSPGRSSPVVRAMGEHIVQVQRRSCQGCPQPTSLRCCMCCRWTDLENNPALQEYANYGLGAAYGLIALVALVSCHAVLLPATAAAATLQQQHLQRCLAATLFEALLQHATWSAYQQQRLITAT